MILGVYGYHNSGKTTFLEKLMAELSKRSISAAAIKHMGGHYHADSKTDTGRLSAAGFNPVIGMAESESVTTLGGKVELHEAIALVQNLARPDVIFIEGFKNSPMDKIAVGKIESLPGTIFRSEDLEDIIRHIEQTVKRERNSMNDSSCCGQNPKPCKGGDKLSELNVMIKVNGKKVPANEFVQKMFWETLCGMVKPLRGVGKDIESIEISVSKE